jgi:hypothetical protein
MEYSANYIPTVRIHPHKIIIGSYRDFTGIKSRHQVIKQDYSEIINEDKANKEKKVQFKARLSKQSRNKLELGISYLNQISNWKKHYDKLYNKQIRFKLTFVTLTLPSRQIHSDKIIRRDCMHHFITVAQRKWNMVHYVYRSERQGNGNIHFHLVTNVFIPHQELKNTWNYIINKLGYVDEYRKNMIEFHKKGFNIRKDLINYWPLKSQKKAYETGKLTDWSSPNSTDIHNLRRISNIKQYICKYLSKAESHGNSKVSAKSINYKRHNGKGHSAITKGALNYIRQNVDCGRLWACSHSLSKLAGGYDVVGSDISQELNYLVDKKVCRYYKGDYCQLLYLSAETLKVHKLLGLLRLLNEYLSSNFGYSIQLEI